jgi:hypothetical protein
MCMVNQKGCERKQSWPVFKYVCVAIYLHIHIYFRCVLIYSV